MGHTINAETVEVTFCPYYRAMDMTLRGDIARSTSHFILCRDLPISSVRFLKFDVAELCLHNCVVSISFPGRRMKWDQMGQTRSGKMTSSTKASLIEHASNALSTS